MPYKSPELTESKGSHPMNIEKARFNMIEQQVKPWKVLDEQLLGAMATLPRELFVPDQYQAVAYADMMVPLGHNQKMLAPRELARLIQALNLSANDKVLDIGCGSGYSTALLAKLTAQVFSVDIFPEFVEQAKQRLQKLSINNVMLEEIDATAGWMAHAPYDAILITSALPRLSNELKDNLKPQGKIAAIIGTAEDCSAVIYELDSQGHWTETILFPIKAVPMINVEQPNQFVF